MKPKLEPGRLVRILITDYTDFTDKKTNPRNPRSNTFGKLLRLREIADPA